jgi:hypothetical protein
MKKQAGQACFNNRRDTCLVHSKRSQLSPIVENEGVSERPHFRARLDYAADFMAGANSYISIMRALTHF